MQATLEPIPTPLPPFRAVSESVSIRAVTDVCYILHWSLSVFLSALHASRATKFKLLQIKKHPPPLFFGLQRCWMKCILKDNQFNKLLKSWIMPFRDNTFAFKAADSLNLLSGGSYNNLTSKGLRILFTSREPIDIDWSPLPRQYNTSQYNGTHDKRQW